MKKKLMSGFLAFCMLAAMAPGALAANAPDVMLDNVIPTGDGKITVGTDSDAKDVWAATWANLHDNAGSGSEVQGTLIDTPKITVNKVDNDKTKSGYDEIYEVKITGSNLTVHSINDNNKSGWPAIGIGVLMASQDKKPKKMHNGQNDDGTTETPAAPADPSNPTEELKFGYYPYYGQASRVYSSDRHYKTIDDALPGLTNHQFFAQATNGPDSSAERQYKTWYWNVSYDQKYIEKENLGNNPSMQAADGKHGYIIVWDTVQETVKGENGSADTTKNVEKRYLYDVDFSGVTTKNQDVIVNDDQLNAETQTVLYNQKLTDVELEISAKSGADLPPAGNDYYYDTTTGTISVKGSNTANVTFTHQEDDNGAKTGIGVFTFSSTENTTKDARVEKDITIDVPADVTYTVSASDTYALKATYKKSSTEALLKKGDALKNNTITLSLTTDGDADGLKIPSKVDSIMMGEKTLELNKDYSYDGEGVITFTNDKLVADGNIVVQTSAVNQATASVSDKDNLTINDSPDGSEKIEVGTPFTDLQINLALKADVEGKQLPKTITSITMQNAEGTAEPLTEGTDYDYIASTGQIAFKGDKKVTGKIVITATAATKTESIKSIKVKAGQEANLSVTPSEVTANQPVPSTITLAVQPNMTDKFGLPTDISSITVNGKVLEDSKWLYDSTTGVITIKPAITDTVTGDIVINTEAIPQVQVKVLGTDGQEGDLEVKPNKRPSTGSLINVQLTLSVKDGVKGYGVPKTSTDIVIEIGGTKINASSYTYKDGVITFVSDPKVSGDIVITADAVDIVSPVITHVEGQDKKTKTDFEVAFTSTEANTEWHALMQKAEADAKEPTVEEVKASKITGKITEVGGLQTLSSTKDTSLKVEAGTAYKVWVVGTDAAGNDSDLLCIDITTTEKSDNTTITEVCGQSVTWDANKKGKLTIDAATTPKITLDQIKVADETASVKFSGTATEVALKSGETQDVSIIVTSEAGVQDIYTLTVICPAAIVPEVNVSDEGIVEADVTDDAVELVDKAAENGLVINAAPATADETVEEAEVTIPTTVVDKIAETKDDAKPVDTTIKTPKVEITVPAEVMSTAAEALKNDSAAAGKKLKLSVRKSNEGKPANSKGSSYDIKFTYEGADKDHAIDVTTTKTIKLDFARNWSLIPTRQNPILMVWYNPEGKTPAEKYVIQKRITDNNTKSIPLEMNHLSVYSQITMEDLKELGVEISGNSSLTLQQDENGMYYAKDAEKGHWLYFVLNAEDGTGRVQTGMGEVKYEAEDVPFAPMYEGTLNVFELSGVPKFTNGVFQEEGNKLYDNGLGDAVKPMN